MRIHPDSSGRACSLRIRLASILRRPMVPMLLLLLLLLMLLVISNRVALSVVLVHASAAELGFIN